MPENIDVEKLWREDVAEREKQCWEEIKSVLKKNSCAFNIEAILTPIEGMYAIRKTLKVIAVRGNKENE